MLIRGLLISILGLWNLIASAEMSSVDQLDVFF